MPLIDGLAIVLAGGKSRRMGRDKAFLELRGQPLIQQVVQGLRARFETVWVSADTAGRFSEMNLRVICDEEQGKGPLSAMATVLKASPFDLNFFQACDIPHIDDALFQRLYERFSAGADVAVPRLPDGRLAPTFGFYRKSAVFENVLARVASGRLALWELVTSSRAAFVDLSDSAQLPNLNTFADYQAYLKRR